MPNKYSLVLMSSLQGSESNPTAGMEKYRIYIDQSNRNYSVLGDDGALKKGVLPAHINLNNLNSKLTDPELIEQILDYTSKQGHTLLNLIDYDEEKIKYFLTGIYLQALMNRSLVLVIGPSGAGKSTGIGIQQGAVYIRNPNDRGYIRTESNKHIITPATSNDFIAKTLNFGVYEDFKSKIGYLDTAGITENRGKEEMFWVKNNLNLLFSVVGSLKAVLFFVDYSSTFQNRGAGLTDFLRKFSGSLAKIAMSQNSFQNSMIFVVTKAYDEGERISKERLLGDAESQLAASMNMKEELLDSLKRRYPLSVSKKMMATFKKEHEKAPEEDAETEFDISKVPAEDRNQLCELQDKEEFLKIFINAVKKNKFVLSYPNGEKACIDLRKEVLEKINSVQPVTRGDLERIRENHIEDSTLLFTEVITSIAVSYLPSLTKGVEILKSFIVASGKYTDLLNAAELDWEKVRTSIIEEKRKVIKSKAERIVQITKEIEKFKNSYEVQKHKEEHILAERPAGIVGFFKSIFGKAKAQRKYVYNGQSFVSYSYPHEGRVEKFDAKVIRDEPSSGKLEILFTSHNGTDLNLKVRVFVYEKDLPATINQVQNLEQEAFDKKTQLNKLHLDITCLDVVQTKEDLFNEITKEDRALKMELIEIMKMFYEPLVYKNNGKEKPVWHAITGLATLFKLFSQMIVLYSELSPANLSTIKGFINSYDTIEKLIENEYVTKLIPEIRNIRRPILPGPGEQEKPTPTPIPPRPIPMPDLVIIVDKKEVKLSELVAFCFFKAKSHKLESGLCLALLGLLWWYNTQLKDDRDEQCELPTLHSFLIFSIITIGAFIAFSEFKTKLGNGVERVENDFKQLIDDFRIETVARMEGGTDALRRLVEKVNIDIRKFSLF